MSYLWAFLVGADSEVMSSEGICEIEIKSAADQRVVFDIRKTYGSDEDYVFRGANDVTGVVSDRTASFTFSDEYNNRMEGTIEFQEDALKVVVKKASGGQSEGLNAAMECTMKKDKYADLRTPGRPPETCESRRCPFQTWYAAQTHPENTRETVQAPIGPEKGEKTMKNKLLYILLAIVGFAAGSLLFDLVQNLFS